MKINRNAPCPCGSGRKYKYCCLKKKDEMSPRTKLIAVLAGMAFVGIVIFGVVTVMHALRKLNNQPVRRVVVRGTSTLHYVL